MVLVAEVATAGLIGQVKGSADALVGVVLGFRQKWTGLVVFRTLFPLSWQLSFCRWLELSKEDWRLSKSSWSGAGQVRKSDAIQLRNGRGFRMRDASEKWSKICFKAFVVADLCSRYQTVIILRWIGQFLKKFLVKGKFMLQF